MDTGRYARPNHLYVIAQESGIAPVKIGATANPEKRLADLQAASPVSLKIFYLLRVRYDARRFETGVHVALADHRRHGEWFGVTPAQAIETIEKFRERISRWAEGADVVLHFEEEPAA